MQVNRYRSWFWPLACCAVLSASNAQAAVDPAKNLLWRMDRNFDGRIDFEEYRNALVRGFYAIDKDADGNVRGSELAVAMGIVELQISPGVVSIELFNDAMAAGFGYAGQSSLPAQQQARWANCESRENQLRECSMGQQVGRFTRQLSAHGCWRNDSWGYGYWDIGPLARREAGLGNQDFSSGRFWTNYGCQAQFFSGQHVDELAVENSVTDRALAERVIRAIAGAIADSDNARYYSTDNRNYSPNLAGQWGNPRAVVRCKPRGDLHAYCKLPIEGHVELFRQLGKAACLRNGSWSAEGDKGPRIWVSSGCDGEFAVY